MQKTVVVAVDRMQWVPKYKVYRKWTTKLKAHDEDQSCDIGDVVRIEASKRYSKSKAYRVATIEKKISIFDAARAEALANASGSSQDRVDQMEAAFKAAQDRLQKLRLEYGQLGAGATADWSGQLDDGT